MRLRKRRCPKHGLLLVKHAGPPAMGLVWMWLCPKGDHVQYSRRNLRSTP